MKLRTEYTKITHVNKTTGNYPNVHFNNCIKMEFLTEHMISKRSHKEIAIFLLLPLNQVSKS